MIGLHDLESWGYRTFAVRVLRSQRLWWRSLSGKTSSWVEIPMSSGTHGHFNFLVYGVDLAVRSIRQSALIIRWFVSSDMVLAQLTENPAKKLILSDPWQVVSVWFCSVLVGLPPMSLRHDAILPRFCPPRFRSVSWFDPTTNKKVHSGKTCFDVDSLKVSFLIFGRHVLWWTHF